MKEEEARWPCRCGKEHHEEPLALRPHPAVVPTASESSVNANQSSSHTEHCPHTEARRLPSQINTRDDDVTSWLIWKAELIAPGSIFQPSPRYLPPACQWEKAALLKAACRRNPPEKRETWSTADDSLMPTANKTTVGLHFWKQSYLFRYLKGKKSQNLI